LPNWEKLSVPLNPEDSLQEAYEILIPGLDRSMRYFFKVQAVSENGPGIISPEISIVTEDEGTMWFFLFITKNKCWIYVMVYVFKVYNSI